MATSGIITLTTDFGTRDTFVGQMKGIVIAAFPSATLVDLTHEVPPQDVVAGAYHLWTAYRAFPEGTVHVAVVDPGVGTGREPIAVSGDGSFFVAPDNGILSRVLADTGIDAAHVIADPRVVRRPTSPTFEGRDVFAPAAAWLASGRPIAGLGPPAGDPARMPGPPDLVLGGTVDLRVVAIDRFGNVVLDVSPRSVAGAGEVRVRVPDGSLLEFHRTFAEAPPDVPFVLRNSSGLLEIAIRDGNASARLGLVPGAVVAAIAGPPPVL